MSVKSIYTIDKAISNGNESGFVDNAKAFEAIEKCLEGLVKKFNADYSANKIVVEDEDGYYSIDLDHLSKPCFDEIDMLDGELLDIAGRTFDVFKQDAMTDIIEVFTCLYWSYYKKEYLRGANYCSTTLISSQVGQCQQSCQKKQAYFAYLDDAPVLNDANGETNDPTKCGELREYFDYDKDYTDDDRIIEEVKDLQVSLVHNVIEPSFLKI